MQSVPLSNNQEGNPDCRDDALQTRTNEVTDALRRTTQTMQTELERSVLSVQMLGQSSVPSLLRLQ